MVDVLAFLGCLFGISRDVLFNLEMPHTLPFSDDCLDASRFDAYDC